MRKYELTRQTVCEGKDVANHVARKLLEDLDEAEAEIRTYESLIQKAVAYAATSKSRFQKRSKRLW